MKIRTALLSLVLAGCATPGIMNGVIASWQGATVDQVIKQWGYPHEERRVAGRTLLVWNRNVQLTMPATTNVSGTAVNTGGVVSYSGTAVTTPGGTTSWSCTRILEVGPANTIVGGQWEGNNCPFMEVGEYGNWRRKP